MPTIRKDLGVATAYGYAKSKGYTGTEEEFAQLMASYASVATDAAASAAAAEQSAANASTSAIGARDSAFAAADYATAAGEKADEASDAAADANADAAVANQRAIDASNSASVSTNKASEAADSATTSENQALKSEGHAVGTQNDVNVSDGSPYYHNNAKYYAEQAQEAFARKGQANGIAELDANGKVPSSQLPSFVDDVLEFASASNFPATGESSKIYIALDTNITYRWGGSQYVKIGSDLALGETENSAYRGDRGKIAYDHAAAKGYAFNNGLYKFQTNNEGHVVSATSVVKKDITDLGIPGSVPANVSELTNDSGYITTETDPTVPAWAKEANKPSYTAAEVGLGNVANERQYSANNPPPSDNTKQNKINVSGVLKGDGNGGVFAAIEGTDYINGDIIAVQNETPTDPNTQLWLPETQPATVQVASYEELTQLSNALTQSSENTSIAISAHPVGDLFWYNGTLHVATSAIAVGDTIVDTGTGANCKDTSISEALIKDIQINGSSILVNGVANIPPAVLNGTFGIVKLYNDNYGLDIDGSGRLVLIAADDYQIRNSLVGNTRPITTERQHKAVFYGLAVAAGGDESSNSTVGSYSENSKSKISQMLNGAVQVTGTTPVIVAKPGVPYRCGECATLDITAPESGCVDITFTSGSTPTVLTVTSAKSNTTIKWANGFDPSSLDANTVYEVNILDGEFGVVGKWT